MKENMDREGRDLQAKEQVWEDMRARVEKVTDMLDGKVDEGIKETVVAFNVLGAP